MAPMLIDICENEVKEESCCGAKVLVPPQSAGLVAQAPV